MIFNEFLGENKATNDSIWVHRGFQKTLEYLSNATIAILHSGSYLITAAGFNRDLQRMKQKAGFFPSTTSMASTIPGTYQITSTLLRTLGVLLQLSAD